MEALVRCLDASDVVPAEVYDELTNRKKAGAARTILRRCGIDQGRDTPIDSPQGRMYSSLRRGRTSLNDAGEAACTVWAFHHPELFLVTGERGAAYLALRELGGRVLLVPWFLRARVEQGTLDLAVAIAIFEHRVSSQQETIPTWWNGWVEGRKATIE